MFAAYCRRIERRNGNVPVFVTNRWWIGHWAGNVVAVMFRRSDSGNKSLTAADFGQIDQVIVLRRSQTRRKLVMGISGA